MIGIRVDANPVIATGHLMRCLAIADAVRALGHEVLFFLADEYGAEIVRSYSFPCRVLGTEWNRMEEELSGFLPLLRSHGIKNLLVDSYSVTAEYLGRLKQETRIFYLDDLNAFHYPVHGLICYANYYEKYDYPGNYPDAELLLGPSYVPLRKEFRELPPHRVAEKMESLLILSGGADPENVLERLLSGLDLSAFEKVNVVCGRYYQRYEELRESFSQKRNIEIHHSVPTLLELIQGADLAISAGGTTLYELCAAGTPAICYSMADNQLDNVKQFEKDGLMIYAGDARKEDFLPGVKQGLVYYEGLSPEDRKDLSGRLRLAVDGLGAQRIARRLCGLGET